MQIYEKFVIFDYLCRRKYRDEMSETYCKIEFVHAVADVVAAIPAGKVLTYGDVAAIAGHPTCARQVGHILGAMGFDSPCPCHRVVNAEGRIAPHWPEQAGLLAAEGVVFSRPGFVNMKRHRWHPLDEERFEI